MTTQLITGTSCDVDTTFLEENNVKWVPMIVVQGDKEYRDQVDIDRDTLFEDQRAGRLYTTSHPSLATQKQYFEEAVAEGRDILYISLSSGISSEYECALMAVKEIDLKGSKCKIVDTKNGSAGQALMMYYLIEAVKKGMDFEMLSEFADFLVEETRSMMNILDMQHLYNGGRVSRLSFTAGKLMNIKPIIGFSKEGKLEPFAAARGNKNSAKKLIEIMKKEKHGDLFKDELITLVIGNAFEMADTIEEAILKEEPTVKIKRSRINCGIAAHVGESMIGLGYLAKEIPTHIKEVLNR